MFRCSDNIMATDKEKLKIGGIAFAVLLLGSLSGVGLNDALNSDITLYKCFDEQKVRNCPNGIKADGKRCYYNETNPYAYDYCSTNWTKVNKEKLLEEMYGKKDNKQGKVWGKQFKCNNTGCLEVK